MKRAVSFTLLAIACVFAVSVAAQSTYPTEQKPTSMTESKTVKVIGCLTSGIEPNSFILTNASEAKPATTGTTGTPSSSMPPSTSESASAGGSNKTFKLAADSGVDLKPHVGHKIEVTGTLASETRTTTMSEKPGEKPTGTTSGPRGSEQKITVRSIRHISDKCGEPSPESASAAPPASSTSSTTSTTSRPGVPPPPPSSPTSPPPQQVPQTQTQTSVTSESRSVTLTGCLQAGTEPNSFLLANVSSQPASPGAVGTAGSSSLPAGATYQLAPGLGVDLKAHVGHKIEVTGLLSEQIGRASTTTTPPSDPPSAVSSTASTQQKLVTVNSVRMIDATCPSAK